MNMISNIKNLSSFIVKSFVNKAQYPIISVILFILVVILNSIQYSENNVNYLQSKLVPSKYSPRTLEYTKYSPTTDYNFFGNSMIFFLDLIGVNGFIINTPAHVILLILTYTLMGLAELNIGHIGIIYFLVVLMMMQYFMNIYSNFVCINDEEFNLFSSQFCCGSFIWVPLLGFFMYVIQRYLSMKWRITFIFLMLITFGIFVIVDYTVYMKNIENDNSRICKSLLWHACAFVFGIFSAIALSNTNHYLKI